MVFGITRHYAWVALPGVGFFMGRFLDDKETERMTMYRDKSALYGGNKGPNDEPSW